MFVAIYSVAYVVVGLYPFEFDLTRTLRFYSIGTWADVIGNVIAFLPFGLAFAAAPAIRSPRLSAAVFCGILAICIEALQIFVPQRFPQVSDIICNCAGGWIGAWLWPHQRRTTRP